MKKTITVEFEDSAEAARVLATYLTRCGTPVYRALRDDLGDAPIDNAVAGAAVQTLVEHAREHDWPASPFIASKTPDRFTAHERALGENGNKIAAIKAYRTRTGCGLREAINDYNAHATVAHVFGGGSYIPVASIEPTWTSEDGRTMRLRDMPTTYLRNIERFAAYMGQYGPGSGLFAAVRAELSKRERAAS